MKPQSKLAITIAMAVAQVAQFLSNVKEHKKQLQLQPHLTLIHYNVKDISESTI